MVSEGASYIISGEWWTVVFPGGALVLAVFCFNLLGDGLRDVLDPAPAHMTAHARLTVANEVSPPGANSPPLLSVDGLTLDFRDPARGDVHALDGRVSFDVRAGRDRRRGGRERFRQVGARLRHHGVDSTRPAGSAPARVAFAESRHGPR